VIRALPLLTVALLATPALAASQEAGLAVEVAGGLAVPTGSLSSGTGTGESVSAGSSLGISFVSPRSERLALRLGFTQHRFGCSDAGCGTPDEYVVTGLNVGMRASLLPGASAAPWLGAALISARAETQGLAAPDDGVSSHALGLEVGGGFVVPAGQAASLRPAVAWALANPKLPGGETLSLRYFTAQLILEVRF